MGWKDGRYVREGNWKQVSRDDLLWYALGQYSDRDLARRYSFLTPEAVRGELLPVREGAQPIDAIVAREMERDTTERDR